MRELLALLAGLCILAPSLTLRERTLSETDAAAVVLYGRPLDYQPTPPPNPGPPAPGALALRSDRPDQRPQPVTYQEAHARATRDKIPLVAVITATWCAPCRQLKATLPRVERSGCLDRVAYCHVDVDREKANADKLRDGPTVPQIVVWRQRGGTWGREVLHGAKSAADVEAFIRRACAP